ncbi:MAG: iron export ABC transporter permease subunit FetB [Chloroflexota bacterium]|nr:iron export ABC transporter permease subunit FetB [Chloroflexota bacterium]
MPDIFAELAGIDRVLLSIAFVFIAAAISRWQRSDLEKDLAIAALRSFIQLIAIGYALELVFEMDVPLFTIAILLVMITIGGRTSGARAKNTPNAVMVAFLAIGIGSGLTIALLVALGVFQFVPKDIIPIGGMIVGTSMTTATLVITRLSSDFYDQRDLIESKLALGATSRQASLTQFQRAIVSAMTPIIDTTKTVGLIKLPGAMTGMILAGASPLEAVQLQIIVMYMLVGAAVFTGLIAAWLTYRQFFSPVHQLVLE